MNELHRAMRETSTTFFDLGNQLLTGEEKYKMHGDAITETDCSEIWSKLKYMKRKGNCLWKAIIAKKYLDEKYPSNKHTIVMGRTFVWNPKTGMIYWFDYTPPTEYHTWIVRSDGALIDFAMPGMIERAIESGCFAHDTDPFIIAVSKIDDLPDNVRYRSCYNYHGDGAIELLPIAYRIK